MDSAYVTARFYHHDAFHHALLQDISVPTEFQGADGQPDMRRLEQLLREHPISNKYEKKFLSADDRPTLHGDGKTERE